MSARGRERLFPARSEDIFRLFTLTPRISCLCLSLLSPPPSSALATSPTLSPTAAAETLFCGLLYSWRRPPRAGSRPLIKEGV